MYIGSMRDEVAPFIPGPANLAPDIVVSASAKISWDGRVFFQTLWMVDNKDTLGAQKNLMIAYYRV